MKKFCAVLLVGMFIFTMSFAVAAVTVDGNTADWFDVKATQLSRSAAESMCAVKDLAVKWQLDEAAQAVYLAVSGHAPGDTEASLYGAVFHINDAEVAFSQLPDVLRYNQNDYHVLASLRDFGNVGGDFFFEFLLQAKTPVAYMNLADLSMQVFDKFGEISKSFFLGIPVVPAQTEAPMTDGVRVTEKTSAEKTTKTTTEKTTTEKTTKTTTTKSTTRTTLLLTISRSETEKKKTTTTKNTTTKMGTANSAEQPRTAATTQSSKFMPQCVYITATVLPQRTATTKESATPLYFGAALSSTITMPTLPAVLRETDAQAALVLEDERVPAAAPRWGVLLLGFFFFLLAAGAVFLYWRGHEKARKENLDEEELPPFDDF
jgi:hypothetical protein